MRRGAAGAAQGPRGERCTSLRSNAILQASCRGAAWRARRGARAEERRAAASTDEAPRKSLRRARMRHVRCASRTERDGGARCPRDARARSTVAVATLRGATSCGANWSPAVGPTKLLGFVAKRMPAPIRSRSAHLHRRRCWHSNGRSRCRGREAPAFCSPPCPAEAPVAPVARLESRGRPVQCSKSCSWTTNPPRG
jgi:hypothetical protein